MLLEPNATTENVVDPRDAAETAGLTYVSDEAPGIRRRKSGKGFTYTEAGRRASRPTRRRWSASASLAIPPAWTDVWICAEGQRPYPGDRPRRQGPQAVPLPSGFPRGAREHEVRAHARLRARRCRRSARRIDEHMSLRGLPREKVLATVVHLLENDPDPRRQRRIRASRTRATA